MIEEKEAVQLTYVSMLSDSTFKYMFKDEKTRKILNKIIYLITKIDISDYTLVDNELNSGNKFLKDYRLDLLFEKDNNIISIEMNAEYDEEYTTTKSYTYLFKLIGSAQKEGEAYKKVHVKQINFNNGYLKENKKVGIATYELYDRENELSNDMIEIKDIFLKKYKNVCYNKVNEAEMFLSMFTAKSYDELDKIIGNHREAKIVEDKLKELSLDEKFIGLYNAEERQRKLELSARESGYNKGYTKGIEEEKKNSKKALEEEKKNSEKKTIDIVKNLLSMNMSMEDVSKATGIPMDELEKL